MQYSNVEMYPLFVASAMGLRLDSDGRADPGIDRPGSRDGKSGRFGRNWIALRQSLRRLDLI